MIFAMDYGRSTIAIDDPPDARIVHNFPSLGRRFGEDGFRYWVADGPQGHRCYCDWLDGCEHYGTVTWIDAARETHHR